MYLLDTVVLSELRKRTRDRHVVTWFGSVESSDLYLSTITVAEIERGIARQQSANPDFARDLAGWLDTLLAAYGDHVLPLTVGIARRWGRLSAQIGNDELDLAIAATALDHGLTVVTRNIAHFEPTGVALLNPFQPRARGRN